MNYLFILGNNPSLSIAEIYTLFNSAIQVQYFQSPLLIIKTEEKLDLEQIQRKLGGTIKIGEVLDLEYDLTKVSNKIDLIISQLASSLILSLSPEQSRIYFGVSYYQENKLLKAWSKKIALGIKKELKQNKLSCRWVVSKKSDLSSVILRQEKIMSRGAEFIFWIQNKRLKIGRIKTCQDFKDYSWRDYGRPGRLINKGMIPPKLAKIMLNLSQVSHDQVILDPFCGVGTILQEAICLRHQRIIGSDIDLDSVQKTKENIEWLLKNKLLNNKKIEIKQKQIFQTDVCEINAHLKVNSIDVIVSEPYLGPLRIKDVQQIVQELSALYLKTFNQFKKILKQKGRIVIIFPVFKQGNKLNFIPILDQLEKQGWEMILPAKEILTEWTQNTQLSRRKTLVYSRPDQKVLREVLVFRKKS